MNRKTYESFKERRGENYPRTLMAAHNLADSLRVAGDCFAARDLDQDTLERRLYVLGSGHPYTLSWAADLARDVRETGAFRSQRGPAARNLADVPDGARRRPVDTLRAAASLAASLRGERRGARGDEPVSGHLRAHQTALRPRVAGGASLRTDTGLRLRSGRRLCPGTGTGGRNNPRTAGRSSLGESHPFTLTAASDLAIYLRGSGELARACHLAEETLATMRGRLGDDHPYSLSCAINLANCYGDSELLTQAEPLERQTIARLRKKLGADHPDTLACEANLAVTLRRAGRDDEAERARAQT